VDGEFVGSRLHGDQRRHRNGLTVLATTVNLPAGRTPSPQIRARDTSLDGPTNGSAGINSAPNVDAGSNGATHLGGRRCGDREGRGDSTDYRKLAEHEVGPQQGRSWRRRANIWRRVTSPVRGAKRLRAGTANGQRHDAPGSKIDRAPSRAHSAKGSLWRIPRELPRWKRGHSLLQG